MDIIDKRACILRTKKEIIEKLFDKKNSSPKYILGINTYCDTLLLYFSENQIEFSGIIDDYTAITVYKSIPVFKMREIMNKNSIIVSCVVDCRIQTALNNLKSNGFVMIVNYLELCLNDPALNQIHFCKNNINDIKENKNKYDWLFDLLEDDLSKKTLRDITDFRYNFNIDALKDILFDPDRQYFDSFVAFKESEVFVDCGGFNGNTTKMFILKNPNYKKIYYIEPASDYFHESIENLKDFDNIVFINKATYSKNTILKFKISGSDSSFSNAGEVTVETIRLDDVINEQVTYIKMDVEGAEYASLIGAERLIRQYKPKLAICVYHNQEDFWMIPELVLKYNKNYKVYLRHYTEGLLETVIYFL